MKSIKIVLMLTIAFVAPSLMKAQDKLANVVTPDVQLKQSSASKALESAIVANVSTDASLDAVAKKVEELYANYQSAAGLHIYKGVEKPNEFKIILNSTNDPRFTYHAPMQDATVNRNVITSNYGYRARFKRNHYGLDIKGYVTDTVRAVYAGYVRVKRYDANGFGNYVVVRHPNGLETVYGHLTAHDKRIEVGTKVYAGQALGLCGDTGRSFGSHLHLEARFLGEPIDPSLLFDIPNGTVKCESFVFHPNNNTKANQVGAIVEENNETALNY